MPAVGAAIVAIGGSIGLTAAASMTVAIQLGVSAAMSVASNIMRRRAMADSAQTAGIRTERKGTGGVNSRTLMLGRYATAGTDICPPMSHGRTSQTPNIYLTQVIALADLPVGGLSRVIINGEYVQLEAFTGPFGPEYRVLGKYQSPDADDQDDPDRAWVRFYDGTQTAACPYLVGNYSNYPDRPWSPAMIGSGMAYAVMVYRFEPSVWTGEPVAKFEIDGCRLYDPRRDSTVGGSGSHRWADQSTWGGPGDHNPIVMVYNILRGIRMRDGSIYGGRAEAADLPLDNWVAAMNRCDETVDGQPRFRAGYEVRVAEDQPADVIDELLLTCLGEMVEVGGYFKVRVGGPGLPVGFFVDSDFLNSQPKEFDPFPPLTSTHNLVNYVFPHPAELYASHDGPVWMPEPVTTERPLSLAFKALPYPAQAQRVARAMLADDQRHRVHTTSLGPYASHLEPLDVIEWTSARNGYIDKRFDIRQTTENIRNLCLGLGMRETDPNDYDYRPGEDLPDPVAPGDWQLTPVQSVPGWDVKPYIIIDNASNARAPALRAFWTANAAIDAASLIIRYRVAGQEDYMTKPVERPSLVSSDIIAEGIRSNVDYEACARYIVPGRRTEFTSWIPVRSPDVGLSWEDFDADVRARIDAMEADAIAAAQEAREALDAINGVETIIDQAVSDARQEIEIGYNSAIGDAAREVFEMSSRVGATVITVPLLEAPWSRWNTQGDVANVANEIYPSGRTWYANVTVSQQAGIVLSAPNAAIWAGQMDADGYVVEVEYTLYSGSLSGAGVALDWNTTNGEFRTEIPLFQMVSGSSLVGRTTLARAVFRRPSAFAGTFASHDLFVFANYAGFEGMAAKQIAFHRVTVRVATAEELGGGQVMAAVEAKLSNEYLTRTDTEQALGSINQLVTARFEGNEAQINRNATTLANLNGAAAIVTTEVVAGQERASIRQAAWDGVGGVTPGSAIVFDADDIILRGSVALDHLVVGTGKNKLIDPDFQDGTSHYIRTVESTGYVLWLRQRGQDWAHPAWPTLEFVQWDGNAAAAWGDVWAAPIVSPDGDRAPGVSAEPGKIYTASAYLSTHSTTAEIILQFFSATGGPLGSFHSAGLNFGTGAPRNPDTWQRVSVSGQAPAGTAFAILILRKWKSTSNSVVFMWKPQLEESAYIGQGPSQWSPGGQTYSNGGRLFANSVGAREANFESFAAVEGWIKTATIGDLQVDTLKLGPNAVTMHWGANANFVYFTLAYPATITMLSNVRVAGVGNTHDMLGRLRLDGVLNRESSFSVSPYTWRNTMMSVIPNVPAGVHYVEHEYQRIGGTQINPSEISEYQILVIGHYK